MIDASGRPTSAVVTIPWEMSAWTSMRCPRTPSSVTVRVVAKGTSAHPAHVLEPLVPAEVEPDAHQVEADLGHTDPAVGEPACREPPQPGQLGRRHRLERR